MMSGTKGKKIRVLENGKYWECKIIDTVKDMIKIHYVKFNQSFDEWIEVNSDRIERNGVAASQSADESTEAGLSNGKRRRDDEEMEEPEGATAAKRPSIQSADPLIPTGNLGTTTVSTQNEVEVPRPSPESPLPNCNFCCMSIQERSILCRGCNSPFHLDEICLGVKAEVLHVLADNRDGALSYNCCLCRLGEGSASADDGGAFKQLLCSLGGLTRLVRGGGASLLGPGGVRNLGSSGSSESAAGSGNSALPAGRSVSRSEVMEQVRELRERDKRADSVVLRGLGDLDLDEVRRQFSRICEVLGLPDIVLAGLVRIGNHNLYRGKVSSREQRQNLLARAPDLRNSDDFSGVYVNRDLTLLQRQELRDFRRERQGESSGFSGVSAAVGGPVFRGARGRASRSCGRGGRSRGPGFARGRSGSVRGGAAAGNLLPQSDPSRPAVGLGVNGVDGRGSATIGRTPHLRRNF